MTIATVKPALGTLFSGVTGIKRVYTHAPLSLVGSDLPAMVLFTGAAEYSFAGIGKGSVLEERTYTAILYIAPIQTGIPGEIETACEPFFPLVRNAVFNAPTLSGLDGVSICRITGDSGVTISNYGGTPYAAIEFTVKVTERVSAGG